MSTSPAVDGDGPDRREVDKVADQLSEDETRLRLERSAEILRGMVEQGGNPDDVKAALEQLRRIDRVLASRR